MSPPRLAGADARRHLFGLNEINQRLRLPGQRREQWVAAGILGVAPVKRIITFLLHSRVLVEQLLILRI